MHKDLIYVMFPELLFNKSQVINMIKGQASHEITKHNLGLEVEAANTIPTPQEFIYHKTSNTL